MPTNKHETPLLHALGVGTNLAIEITLLEHVANVVICGSVRRRMNMPGLQVVNDVDIAILVDQRDRLLPDVDLPSDMHVTPKTANVMRENVWCECWWCPPGSLGAMTLFLTGPYDLNVYMRRKAQDRRWKLSQYGLTDDMDFRIDVGVSTGPDMEIEEVQRAIFYALDMPYMTPAEREDWKEVLRTRVT